MLVPTKHSLCAVFMELRRSFRKMRLSITDGILKAFSYFRRSPARRPVNAYVSKPRRASATTGEEAEERRARGLPGPPPAEATTATGPGFPATSGPAARAWLRRSRRARQPQHRRRRRQPLGVGTAEAPRESGSRLPWESSRRALPLPLAARPALETTTVVAAGGGDLCWGHRAACS